MRNIISVLFGFFIVTCSIFLFKQNDKKSDLPFVFKRFMEDSINPLEFKKKIESELKELSPMRLLNDSLLFVYNDEKSSFMQYNLKRERIEGMSYPFNRQGLIVDMEPQDILFVDEGALQSINLQNNQINTYLFNGLEVFNACKCEDGCPIIIGWEKNDTANVTGFYKIQTEEPLLRKEIAQDKTEQSRFINHLTYNGYFSKCDPYIIYVCTMMSLIYVFDLNGDFIKEIHTKEQVPNPVISNFHDTYIYTRGQTFNTNIGVFSSQDEVYVLSYRCNEEKGVVVDKYSIKDGDYQGSFLIPEMPVRNQVINQIIQSNDRIVFVSKQQLFLFFKE